MARFPKDFTFQLTTNEWEQLQPELLMREKSDPLRSQIVISNNKGGLRYLPFVFTEEGMAMLSSVLHSNRAVQMNIAIMRAFVEIRRLAIEENDLKLHFDTIRERLGEHDGQLNAIYDAIENRLDEKAAQRKWEKRPHIGFSKKIVVRYIIVNKLPLLKYYAEVFF